MSDLTRFRADDTEAEAIERVELIRPHKPARYTLAFDQSLSDTGVVFLIGSRIAHTENIRIEKKAEFQGKDFLERAVELKDAVRVLVMDYRPDVVVIESPPMGRSGHLKSSESSLMAATAIRLAISDTPLMVVSAKRAKKRLTGNGNAKKPLVRKAVLDMLVRLGMDKPKPFNEAVADALAVGWTACEDEVRDV